MEINKKIRSNQPEIDNYIEQLENHILDFDVSSIKRLIVACNEVAGIIADDIILLKENTSDDEIDNKLQMMGSKKNKIYQRYREIVGDLKHFKTLHDMNEDLKPKVAVNSIETPVQDLNTPIKDEIKPRNISDLAKKKRL